MAVTVVINGTVYAGVAQVSLTGQSGGNNTYLYVTDDPNLIDPASADITINGTAYSGVSVVALPIQGGGTAQYVLASGGLYPSTTLYPSAGGGNTIYPWSSGTPMGIALEDGSGGETISVYLLG